MHTPPALKLPLRGRSRDNLNLALVAFTRATRPPSMVQLVVLVLEEHDRKNEAPDMLFLPIGAMLKA